MMIRSVDVSILPPKRRFIRRNFGSRRTTSGRRQCEYSISIASAALAMALTAQPAPMHITSRSNSLNINSLL
jgi:hypothetical protein